MSKLRPRLALAIAGLAALSVVASCESNPIDTAIDAALDFEGFFRASDGTEIELVGDDAIIRTSGSARISYGTFNGAPIEEPLEVGALYFHNMYPDDEVENRWIGNVQGKGLFTEPGSVILEEDGMIVSVSNGRGIPGHEHWTKIDEPSGGSGSGPGNGGGTAGSTVVLYEKNLEGDERSARRYTVTLPSGVKKLTVETFEEDQWGRNLGDLFVSYGSQPSASHHPYTWTAQCASVESNRARETCSFTNPAAGTWHILLYGYHAYYGTSLKVTIDK